MGRLASAIAGLDVPFADVVCVSHEQILEEGKAFELGESTCVQCVLRSHLLGNPTSKSWIRLPQNKPIQAMSSHMEDKNDGRKHGPSSGGNDGGDEHLADHIIFSWKPMASQLLSVSYLRDPPRLGC